MVHQLIRKSSSWNPPTQEKSSPFALRPLAVQAQQDSHRPPNQEEEDEASNQNMESAARLGHHFTDIPVHSPDAQVSAPVQPKFAIHPYRAGDQQQNGAKTGKRSEATADSGTSEVHPENKTGLPDHLKAGIENLSGMALDDVRVHYHSLKPAQLHALAYTQGTEIHVAPGQERHLPHETWHVVQQVQGRVKPTMQMRTGVPVNDDQGLEREADVMGGRAADEIVPAAGQKARSDPTIHTIQIIQRMVGANLPSGAKVKIINEERTDYQTVGKVVRLSGRGDEYIVAVGGKEKRYGFRELVEVSSSSSTEEPSQKRRREGTGEHDVPSATGMSLVPRARRPPAEIDRLSQDLLLYILQLAGGVQTIFGKRIASDPGVLASVARVCQSWHELILNNPAQVGYYVTAMNTIDRIQSERKAWPSIFQGKYPQIMNPNEMQGLQASAQSIVTKFPVKIYAYISLGNSPVPVMAYIEHEVPGCTILPLPLSGVGQEGIEAWRDPTKRVRMVAYLDQYITPEKLKGKLPLVIDVAATGTSLRVTRYFIQEYYKVRQYNTTVTMLALNEATRQTNRLSQEIPGEVMPGLDQGSQKQKNFLHLILEKSFKEGLRYLMWNRNEMIDIFRGERVTPELQEANYQRMLVEIRRIKAVLNDMNKLEL